MTIKEYKSPIIAKQPGHLQKQHLWNARACCVHTQKHPSYKSILFKYKKQSSFPQSSVSAAPVLLQNLLKAWGGGMLLSPQGSQLLAPVLKARVGNPRSKERNMMRSTWWWTRGCREHCQSPSDLPKSRESGPGRGACLLPPVPWETETWDMSLPIISFTEKQKRESD